MWLITSWFLLYFIQLIWVCFCGRGQFELRGYTCLLHLLYLVLDEEPILESPSPLASKNLLWMLEGICGCSRSSYDQNDPMTCSQLPGVSNASASVQEGCVPSLDNWETNSVYSFQETSWWQDSHETTWGPWHMILLKEAESKGKGIKAPDTAAPQNCQL